MLTSIKHGLKRIARRLLQAPAPVQETPLQLRFAPPGHYYSPFPDIADVERNAARYWSEDEAEPGNGIDLNDAGHRQFLEQLADWYSEFDIPDGGPTPGRRYHTNNYFFGITDVLALYGVMRRHGPRRVIEVGSGFSSAALLDIDERHLGGRAEFTFIEPHPERLDEVLRPGDRERCRIIRRPVQELPPETFDALEANDVLFIDSSHVAKIGSDVHYLLFRVLPRLKSGVVIHVHDVFWPFEYPRHFFREGRAWNELYFLRAFLMYNPAFRVEFFGSYAARRFPDFLRERLPRFHIDGAASLWLQKV